MHLKDTDDIMTLRSLDYQKMLQLLPGKFKVTKFEN